MGGVGGALIEGVEALLLPQQAVSFLVLQSSQESTSQAWAGHKAEGDVLDRPSSSCFLPWLLEPPLRCPLLGLSPKLADASASLGVSWNLLGCSQL